MTKRVDSTKIEDIVGAKREPYKHLARAVSDEQMVYILHSQQCLEAGDLRYCPYSMALDKGIDLERWAAFQDEAVRVMVSYGELVPYEAGSQKK